MKKIAFKMKSDPKINLDLTYESNSIKVQEKLEKRSTSIKNN